MNKDLKFRMSQFFYHVLASIIFVIKVLAVLYIVYLLGGFALFGMPYP